MESTPGPKYSTIAPVPPFTVKIPATFRITSVKTNTTIHKVTEVCILVCVTYGRRGGLMVSVLDSGSSGPGLGPGDIMLCSWARHFTLTVPLSIQLYK